MTNILMFRNTLPEKKNQETKNRRFLPSRRNEALLSGDLNAYERHTFPARFIDLRNAKARAVWTLKYFGGIVCPDNRSEQERRRYQYWHASQLKKAQDFLWGFHVR